MATVGSRTWTSTGPMAAHHGWETAIILCFMLCALRSGTREPEHRATCSTGDLFQLMDPLLTEEKVICIGFFIAENDWKSREIVKLLRNHWKVSSVDSWHCSLLISPGCYSLIGFPMRLSLFWEYRKKSIHKESLIDSWSWPRIAFSMNRRTLRLIQCSFIYLFKIGKIKGKTIT